MSQDPERSNAYSLRGEEGLDLAGIIMFLAMVFTVITLLWRLPQIGPVVEVSAEIAAAKDSGAVVLKDGADTPATGRGVEAWAMLGHASVTFYYRITGDGIGKIVVKPSPNGNPNLLRHITAQFQSDGQGGHEVIDPAKKVTWIVLEQSNMVTDEEYYQETRGNPALL